MNGREAFSKVTSVLGEYFDGLHHSDTTRLRRVFRRATTAPPTATCSRSTWRSTFPSSVFHYRV